jgi:hypothetical protein
MVREQFKNELIWFIGIIVLAVTALGFANAQVYFGTSSTPDYNDVLNISLVSKFFPHIIILLFFIVYLLRIINENYQNFVANLVFSIVNIIILFSLIDIVLFLNHFKEETLYQPLSAIPHKIENAKSRINPMLYSSIILFVVLCAFQLYVVVKTFARIREHRSRSNQRIIS